MRREHTTPQHGGVLPPGYTQLEYIQSTGTQYIELDMSAPQGFTCYTKFAYTSTQSNKYIVGNGNATSPYERNSVQCNAQFKWMLGLGDTYPSGSNISVNTIYDIHASTIPTNSYLDINGTRTITSSDNTGRTLANLYLLWDNWSKANNGAKTSGKIYNLFVYTSAKSISLVPAIRIADSKPGLYDTTNDVFYTNAGTGEFLYA